ncbi:unnamed protein product (macronuclear) [Paramecium tetraurelia]|uniref:Uncharacterized protein n=1 Tax=Paramecium tetraurelia TaxID=5888 RepID=A0E0K0_PARTE|nr:uncharacterized protein GSPATT00021985001 [Paramecium tetraurelia]CAK88817.1 unnamed protein product [Paramecium tetraurelia]|eukprot:XP_001456214.1 hypothetical protein (macronuclear) [Paramecium tetraurelia strain d4-2]
MKTLDHENLNETLFDGVGIINNDDLQQQLIKKIKDRRFEYLKVLLEQAKQYYLMTFQYRIAAEIDAILNKQPNFIIQILKKQKQIDNIDQYLTKEYTTNDEAIQLAHKVQNQGNMFFRDNIKQLIEFLTQQQQQIKNNQDTQNMLPSYYFTDYLLEKLQQLQNMKSLQSKVEFGKDKFNLIYDDIRNEEDEEETVVDNKVIRIFDRLTYDSIGFFLGVGGQPQSQQVNNMFDAKNEDEDGKQKQDQQYDFNDNSTKEFQELLIYWRIDEGKGNKIGDYGNYNCVGDIYVNKEISSETENLWEKLEESDPMDYQDLWGNVCSAQQGFEIGPQAGIQTRKKNYWKKNKLSDFTIEMWIKPLQSSGQILQVDQYFTLNINELSIEVIIDGQIVQFNIDENDEYNPMNQPQVKVNFWNHICLSYEQSASVLYLYIQAKYQFSCQELEISNELFKNKNLILGQATQDPNPKYPIIKCLITEFRFWKQKFQLKEVRDGYRQPLPIVYEKQKEIKIDIKQESKPKPTTGLNAFQGLKLDFALEPIEEKPTKEVQQEDDGQNVQQVEQPNSDFGWFGGSQPNQQLSNNFEFDSNFNAFAQAAAPQIQQGGEWGSDFSEFANFDHSKPTQKNDFSSFSNENPKPQKSQQQQEQKIKEETKPAQQQKQKQDQPKVEQQSVPKQTDKQQQQQQSQQQQQQQQQQMQQQQQHQPIPQKNSIQEIQQIVDQAVKSFGLKQTKEGVDNLTKAFQKLNEYLQGNKDKLQRIQKFIVHCAQYRFAFQLLIGINQMHEKGNFKKEIYMHLILIHQNIIPSHKLHWIIQSIFICIESENTALAETLLNQLKQSLDKVKLTEEDDKLLKECESKLAKIEDKKNSGLYKLTCPNCKSHFPFKGIKKCNKCNKDFLICQFKLLCISKVDCLKCKACESVFSKESGQVGQRCPYCHIDVLNIPGA